VKKFDPTVESGIAYAMALERELEALRARHERLRKAAEPFVANCGHVHGSGLACFINDKELEALRAALAEEGR
jgi:hypothetical protein